MLELRWWWSEGKRGGGRYLSHLGFARTTSPSGLGACSGGCDNDDDFAKIGLMHESLLSRDERDGRCIMNLHAFLSTSQHKDILSELHQHIYTSIFSLIGNNEQEQAMSSNSLFA